MWRVTLLKGINCVLFQLEFDILMDLLYI